MSKPTEQPPGAELDDELSRLADPPRARSYLWFLGGIGLLVLLEAYGYLFGFPRSPLVFAFVAFAAGIAALAYARRGLPHRTVIQLARDRVVRNTLDSLRDRGFAVFLDVPGGEFRLGHVVVSDRGVLLIEAKGWLKPRPGARITHRGDRILLGGRPAPGDPLLELRARMRGLTNLLEQLTGAPYPVQGALVVPGWPVDRVARSDLWVLEPRDLTESIEREPRRLAQAEIARAAAQLDLYIRSIVGESVADSRAVR